MRKRDDLVFALYVNYLRKNTNEYRIFKDFNARYNSS